MTREDDKILPMCQYCGKYKGIGPCKDPTCPGSKEQAEAGVVSKIPTSNPCSMCDDEIVVQCAQCGQGYCQIHGKGAELSRLGDFYQHIGTCVECKKNVCENCWILNPNGDILCLIHLEKQREKQGIH